MDFELASWSQPVRRRFSAAVRHVAVSGAWAAVALVTALSFSQSWAVDRASHPLPTSTPEIDRAFEALACHQEELLKLFNSTVSTLSEEEAVRSESPLLLGNEKLIALALRASDSREKVEKVWDLVIRSRARSSKN
ncbi:MAG: hypothetical protein ACE15E_22365 [Acidobacteriota bacterium]